MYKTRCHGFCRDVTVKLEYDRGGDADLYTKEDSPPTESDFGSSCSNCLCTSKIATPPDECVVTTRCKLTYNSFICGIIAFKIKNTKLIFEISNILSILLQLVIVFIQPFTPTKAIKTEKLLLMEPITIQLPLAWTILDLVVQIAETNPK